MNPAPVLVVRVDLDRPLPALSPARARGGEYGSAYVVVLRDGRPVGHVEVPFGDGPVSPEQLRERLGDLTSAPAAPVVDRTALPSVTVVVPTTFDRVELLERCVASLVAQDYPAFDVIVVDNRPADPARWARLSTMDSRVSVIGEARPGSSAARNAGVRVATGAVVAFTDDDVEVESGWLRAIGTAFATDPATDCVTGLVLPKELETPAQIWFERSGSKLEQRFLPTVFERTDGDGRYQVTARRPGTPDERFFVYRGKFGMAANIAFRTSVFRELGGFDEALGAGIPTGGGEELQLLARLVHSGRRLRFEPGTAIYHAHRSDFEDLRRRMSGYGSGYTAMLVSLVRNDPRHLVGLARYAVEAARLLLRRSTDRQAAVYPQELSRAEFRGLLKGPWRYLVTRRAIRRWPAPVESAPSPVEKVS
jgi:GT2 family glycosyltransferase